MATLHITNGDSAGDKLRHAVDGPVTLACDALHEGPCPPVDGAAWHEVRGRFLSHFGQPVEAVTASLAADDRAIVDACSHSDIVLWFEHDLFDQLAIIRTLDLMARNAPSTRAFGEGGRASLICIDRFPGVEPFHGLGQLTPEQLATLVGTGQTVTAGHYTLAADAWRAFRSPDPRDLLQIAEGLGAAELPVSEGGPALRFLGAALLRFLGEYPSAANGLSRTEELALTALLEGPAAGAALFGATQAREARRFLGDLTFFETLRRLASARVPLVTVESGSAGHDRHVPHVPDDLRRARIAITPAGRDVVAARADHVRLNGIDIWRGGVHLTGSDRSPWRWDAERETLVS